MFGTLVWCGVCCMPRIWCALYARRGWSWTSARSFSPFSVAQTCVTTQARAHGKASMRATMRTCNAHEMRRVPHEMQPATVEHCMQHRTMHARQVVGRPPHAVHGLLHGVARCVACGGAFYCCTLHVRARACMWVCA
jgi:hypothetical protein